MRQSLVQLRAAKAHRRKAAQTKAVTFVTGMGLVAGGAGLTATGVGESRFLFVRTGFFDDLLQPSCCDHLKDFGLACKHRHGR